MDNWLPYSSFMGSIQTEAHAVYTTTTVGLERAASCRATTRTLLSWATAQGLGLSFVVGDRMLLVS